MLDATELANFALLLIGGPPLLVQPLARLCRSQAPGKWSASGNILARGIAGLPCAGPIILAAVMTPEIGVTLTPLRMWVIAIIALMITFRSWDVLRLTSTQLGGWWRTTAFIYLWPALRYDEFLIPVGPRKWRIVGMKLLSAAVRIPIGLGLFAFGAWMGCPDSSWMLDHLLKLFEIYIFMGGAHDAIVALCALLGWHLDDVFRWPVFSKSILDFWQRYSRHVNAWLRANVFNAAGGRHHPLRAILLVFAFSSVIHEYVFIIALGFEGFLGWQTAFFMLHGVVAIIGLWIGRRLIAKGIHINRAVKIALTFIFIYFSSLLFMHCMDALVIFHEGGIGSSLLNWAQG